MTWFGWLLIALWAANPLVTIYKIGDRRETITRKNAMFSVIFAGLLIVATFTVGTNT